jgi:hypothetical protein
MYFTNSVAGGFFFSFFSRTRVEFHFNLTGYINKFYKIKNKKIDKTS